ncbi:protein of unknown function [Thauera chlorobenzoica]|nr:protein of unknown function [Thauera chlorobenzoica]
MYRDRFGKRECDGLFAAPSPETAMNRRASAGQARDDGRRTCAGWPALAAWLAGGLLLSATAAADIYAFTDEKGVMHVSNVPQDRRYRLILRVPEAAAERRAGRHARAPVRRFQQQVAQAGQAHRVAPALIHAVISTESGYDPRARSHKGAMGLMQLMPETARRYCVDDPYDPAQNIRGGVAYLGDLMRKFNHDPTLALAAYNAGEAAVERHGNRIPPYAETRRYVPRVLDLYARYRRELPPSPENGAAAEDAPGADPCVRLVDGRRAAGSEGALN